MTIRIPKLSLVILIGASGSGKSTFARKHFLPTEAISSDFCRALVCDDDNDQTVTNEAFDVLHYIAAKRLALGKLTVVDATNVRAEDRKKYVELAKKYHCLPVAIVLNVPERLCQERNEARGDRDFGPHVVRGQVGAIRRSIPGLIREGFRYFYNLRSLEEIDAAVIERVPLWTDKRDERGPFDIVGDVHGCCDELEELLRNLGYAPTSDEWSYAHPAGRKVVFLGDLVDRGPRILDALRIAMSMVERGAALCVPGNHDVKLLKKLQGKQVRVTHGLDRTLAELDALSADDPFRAKIASFLDGLIGHYVLDDGKLVVAHAGMKAEMQGRASGKTREFALYGETTGETDEFGLPVRHDWAAEYRGSARVVYGHTPVPEPEWLNRTADIDTGCVFGGKLTALRYPELEFVSVNAARTYCEPSRPFLPEVAKAPSLSLQQTHDNMLDSEDVIGKRVIATRLMSNVIVREENAAAALEIMSRFAIDPRWLVYLPPTMSPCETSHEPSWLEHPNEAFAYYRSQGVANVMCEEKHMGSRAVAIVCRDEAAARERFGITSSDFGIVYTRTGRRFFHDETLERAFLDRLRRAVDRAGFWAAFSTSWIGLDCELMPWSAKAGELVKSQFAAVGSAGLGSLPRATEALAKAANRIEDDVEGNARAALKRFEERHENIEKYVESYRRYCRPVNSLDDYSLAPFFLLASEGAVHFDKNHAWHMEKIAELCEQDPGFLSATPRRLVDLLDPEQTDA